MKIEHHHYHHFPEPLKIEAESPAVLAQLQQIKSLVMTVIQAFEKVAEDNAQLKKALGEIRKKIDEQSELIVKLQSTELNADQEAIVTDLAATTQSLDDVIPDPPAPPAE